MVLMLINFDENQQMIDGDDDDDVVIIVVSSRIDSSFGNTSR